MEQFAYSFALTLMHSIWQMELLLLLYVIITKMITGWSPLAKRNLLFLILGAQVFSSLVSFYVIYSEPFYDFRESAQLFLSSFAVSGSWLRTYAETIFWLYALMVTYRLCSSLLTWMNFSRQYKSGLVKPSIDIRLFTQTKAYHFGINRKVNIWYSENIHSPMTFGFWKPIILLPVALVNKLSLEQTESLVIHELTHIKNSDYLLNWLLVTTEAIYFFNPFVKIVAHKIKLEREKNCDWQVLQFDYHPISYAETLLQTARQQQSAYALQLSAVKNKPELLQRIRFFTENTNMQNRQNGKFPVAFMALALFLVINLFVAGYFLQNNELPTTGVVVNNAFAALPVNEWNKSFTNGPLTNNQTASPATTIQKNMVAKNKVQLKNQASVLTPGAPAMDVVVASIPEPALYSPVSYSWESADEKSGIIIKEEVSSGKIVTKFYQLKNVNGEMVLEPIWMTAELKPLPGDSLKQKIKSDSNHVLKLIPAIQ
jgi:beta-lactamase regulating signal transducer with metallopeptidase domain